MTPPLQADGRCRNPWSEDLAGFLAIDLWGGRSKRKIRRAEPRLNPALQRIRVVGVAFTERQRGVFLRPPSRADVGGHPAATRRRPMRLLVAYTSPELRQPLF